MLRTQTPSSWVPPSPSQQPIAAYYSPQWASAQYYLATLPSAGYNIGPGGQLPFPHQGLQQFQASHQMFGPSPMSPAIVPFNSACFNPYRSGSRDMELVSYPPGMYPCHGYGVPTYYPVDRHVAMAARSRSNTSARGADPCRASAPSADAQANSGHVNSTESKVSNPRKKSGKNKQSMLALSEPGESLLGNPPTPQEPTGITAKVKGAAKGHGVPFLQFHQPDRMLDSAAAISSTSTPRMY